MIVLAEKYKWSKDILLNAHTHTHTDKEEAENGAAKKLWKLANG